MAPGPLAPVRPDSGGGTSGQGSFTVHSVDLRLKQGKNWTDIVKTSFKSICL